MFNSVQLLAQVIVTNTNNANILAQKIVGSGVEISNASVLCNANQSGTFTVTSSTLGMDEGIVLTTGYASAALPAHGVNGPQNQFATFNQGTGGDADLTNLAGITTNDRCVLEFDFKADGDSVFFKYKFGSEEYPVFNCSNYNDVFGFFITGPGYPTPTNLALVPGTNIPVAINSVNNGVISSGGNISNCNSMGAGSPFTGLYVNNTGSTTLTYDGFTQIFTAKAATQSCISYHLKLAIADGFDHIFDSGVFLKAGSLNSNTYFFTVATDSTTATVPFVYEGCSNALLKIHRQNFQSQVNMDTATVVISGTATNGVDYPILQTAYYFSNSVSDSVKNITISPINDLITEGTETLKLVLKNKCGTIVDSLTIEIKDPPKFTVFNNDTTICQGESVQINGIQDPGLTFSWNPTTGVSNPAILNPVLTPTVTTNYIVTSTYGSCVPVKDTVKVIVNPKPNVTATPTNILCNAANNGSILSTATGSAPITFLLNPTSTTLVGSPATFSNLAAGVYTVTATTSLGCTKTAVATITEPTVVNWTTTTSQNVSCMSTNNGQINTTASGGTGSLSYNLMPGNVTNATGNFTTLTAGTYTVSVTDANGCSQTTAFTINQITGLNWAVFTHTNANCNGNPTGTVTANASGGTGTVTYTINPGSISNTTGNFINLSSGTYTVNATDAANCFATSIVVITPPSVLNLSAPTATDILCNGAATGTINISATGGTPTYLFSLNPGSISNTTGAFNTLTAGVYTINVIDANSCTSTSTVTINQPAAIVIGNPTKVNPTCTQPNIGSIVVNASGGTPSLTYKLNALAYQTSNSYSNLSSGTYTITVKDANGCTKTSIVSLAITNAPIIVNNTIPLSCSDTMTDINVTATNGTPAYTYTLLPANISNSTGLFPNIVAGVYTISVVDAIGCTSNISVNFAILSNLTFSIFNKVNIPCSGNGVGSISVLAINGVAPYTYKIDPPGTTNSTGSFPNLSANTYTVTATDVNGCTVSSVTTIAVSPSITFNQTVTTNVLCNGNNTGTMTVSSSGGFGTKLYTLLPGGSTSTTGIFSNLSANNYTINVVDASGCSASTTASITQPVALTINSVTPVIPTCTPGSDGKLTIIASGGLAPFNYQLNTGVFQTNNVFSSLNNGNYIITVKDANNCTKTSIYTLSNPNLPTVNSVNVNQANCAGSSTGSITTIIAGGTTPINYTINPGGFTNTTGIFNALPVNNYTISIVDANSCTIATVATIQQPSAITWNTPTITQVTCNGLANGQIIQTASGGNGVITYVRTPGNISNTTGTFINLSPNTYTITATDANGCSKTTSAQITQPLVFNWNTFTKTNAPCYNTATGIITATASGGTTPVTFLVNPGNISNTTGLFNTLLANTYTITATDANGCSVSSTTTITQPSTALILSQLQNTIPTCNPGNNATITTTVTGGVPNYLYSINGGLNQTSNVFTGIGVSTYTIQVTDAAGCSVTSSLAVANPSSPSITNVTSVNVLCYGNNTGNIVTTATGGTGTLSYKLNPGNIINSTGIYNNLVVNNYMVIVTDANSCSATSNVIISQPPLLIWDSVNNRDVPCFGGSGGLVTSSASGGAGGIVYTLLPNNTSNSTGTFFGLGLGQYTLNAVDSNGCAISSNFIINQAPQIIWNTTTNTPPTCFGDSNGTIHVLVTGGVGGFIYKIQPGNISNTTGNFSGLAAGVYTITAKDANSCTQTTLITINPTPQVILTNAVTTFASCNPGCDGSVTLTASGGNGVYTYSKNGTNFQTSNQFSSLCTGVYTVTIKDGNNCTGTGTFSISTATGPNQITATNSNVSCFGGANGSTTILSTGGTGAMSYKLMPANITNTTGIFPNLTIGTYSIIASDANGCTISTTIQITQPTQVAITSITPTQVSCLGSDNGTLTVLANGGTGAYSYNLQVGNTTNATGNFVGLVSSTYTIKVTDANGCSVTSTQSVGSPSAVLFTSNVSTPVNCFAGNDGTISVAASGGTGLITYSIAPFPSSNTTGNFNNLSAGTYTIIATDVNGCTSSTTKIVTQPTALTITQIAATNPSCVPGGDATMTITASGATPSYSYSINGGTFQTSNIFNNLSTGTYTVIVKDANNCTKSSTKIVAPSNAPIITSITTTEASCNPGCDADITIIASGGTGALSYSNNIPTYQTSNIINNVCANTYTITVKDAIGCTTSSTTIVQTIAGPTLANTTHTNVGCNGTNNGTIHLTTLGGTGNINFVLTPGNITNTNGNFTNLAAGTYSITGSDGKGCTIATSVTIIQPALLQYNNVTADSTLCFNASNGSILAPTSGGTLPITYTISPAGTFVAPDSFINLLGNITYTIVATDANGCSITTNVFVGQPSNLLINSLTNTAVTCNGQNNGTITTLATGGTGQLSYNLLPNNIINLTGSFSNLSGNTYTVKVTDANGCSKTSSTVLFEPTAININNASATNIICFGQINGSVSVNANGGTSPLSYNLMPSNTTNATGNYTALSANIYTVTITDANGCTKTNSQTVVEPSEVHFTTTSNTNVSCFGGNNGTISATANGGVGIINYTLNPSFVTNTTGQFSTLSINTFTITATDGNGCSATTTVTITQPPVLNLVLDSTKNITCFGGNDGLIVTHATGGTPNYTYTLQPTNINSSVGSYPNQFAGNYTMWVTDSKGCITSVPNIQLTQPQEINYTSVTHQDIICYKDSSGSITVNANGGVGTIVYSLTPNVGIQNPQGNFYNLAGGTYTVTATDTRNCFKTTIVTIDANLQLVMDIQFKQPICHGDANGEISINVTGGIPPITYSFNGGQYSTNNVFTNLAAGFYPIIIKDLNNCVVDTNVELTEPEKVGATLTIEPTKCATLDDGKIFVQGTGGRNNYTYYIRPGLYINKHGVFSDLKVGIYTLTVKDSAGCLYDTLVTILPPVNPLSVQFTKQDIGCYGLGNEGWAKAVPTGGEAPYSYLWSTIPIQTNDEATQLEFGKYNVTIIDANGCEIEDSIYINPGPCCDNIFIPNAFSPNGDGKNDVFRIVTAAGFELIQLEVFDRWGNKIWSTLDARNGWNGTYKGKDCDLDTYYYIFRYNCLTTGEKMMKKGDVILVR